MRTPVLLASICALGLSAGALCAQEQDSQLAQRLKPNRELSFNGFNSKFGGGKEFYGGKSISTKSFYVIDKFRAGQYLTGAFAGQSNFWQGDFRYDVKTARVEATRSVEQMARTYDTKELAMKAANEARKEAREANKASWEATRKTQMEARSQRRFDLEGAAGRTGAGWGGELRQLKSVEDIRDLLNKDQKSSR